MLNEINFLSNNAIFNYMFRNVVRLVVPGCRCRHRRRPLVSQTNQHNLNNVIISLIAGKIVYIFFIFWMYNKNMFVFLSFYKLFLLFFLFFLLCFLFNYLKRGFVMADRPTDGCILWYYSVITNFKRYKTVGLFETIIFHYPNSALPFFLLFFCIFCSFWSNFFLCEGNCTFGYF